MPEDISTGKAGGVGGGGKAGPRNGTPAAYLNVDGSHWRIFKIALNVFLIAAKRVALFLFAPKFQCRKTSCKRQNAKTVAKDSTMGHGYMRGKVIPP